MKLIFSALLLISIIAASNSKVFARDIILVENLGNQDQGDLLMKILQKKFNIPQKIIRYKSSLNTCETNFDVALHLCLKADGDMEILKINKFFIENSLGYFLDSETK